MAKYNVTLPVAGYAIVEVEADSEEEAIDCAVNNWGGDYEELDAYTHLVDGNVCNTYYSEANAEEA